MSENTKLAETKKEELTFKSLVSDIDTYMQNDKVNYLLNQNPPDNWVQQHPIIKKEVIDKEGRKVKVPYEYLPIDKVEYLLRRIFKKSRIEVLREGQLFNAVYTTVRVHYKDLITDEWEFHDGVGAWNIQVNKGANASDLSAIKSSAVTMALPLAKTLAIKDATDHFGKLFGSDLNRQGTMAAYLEKDIDPFIELTELFTQADTENMKPDDVLNIQRIIEEKEKANYSKAIKILKNYTK